MHKTVLKTDLAGLIVQRGEAGPTETLIVATYWDGCPLTPRCPDDTSHFCPSSASLSTHILLPPAIQPAEPGVYYRLPHVVCDVVGAAGPLALIPLNVAIEHAPYSAFDVDAVGRAYASDGPSADERVYTTELRYGSHTVCALFRVETAAAWAALPREEWRELHTLGFRRRHSLDPSWADVFRPGAVRISYGEPILNRAVEVSRETV